MTGVWRQHALRAPHRLTIRSPLRATRKASGLPDGLHALDQTSSFHHRTFPSFGAGTLITGLR